MSIPGDSSDRQNMVLASGIEHRLERGEIVTFLPCPFALFLGDDLTFLLQQRNGRIHKNISYNPVKNTL